MEMDPEFSRFLKKGGRSESAVQRIIGFVWEFEEFLQGWRGAALEQARPDDLEAFVRQIEEVPGASAKGRLWGIAYYFEFAAREDLFQLACLMREQRITRRPFLLKEFLGIDPQHVSRLADVGIRNVAQMLKAAKTGKLRAELCQKTGIPADAVLELVKLSDLARVPGIKGIRARLYHDAGIDTLEKMAGMQPEKMLELSASFVERTGFEGVPPLPAEVRFSISRARELPKVVKY
jgi:hypothetical protein